MLNCHPEPQAKDLRSTSHVELEASRVPALEIDLRGWARTSLIDFPDHIATVVFTGGCDFRCPMCHNADLVLRPDLLPGVDPEEVLAFLTRRAGKVTGIVVTGGEPLLQQGLPAFLSAARARGVAVKLDTNGTHPDRLADLLNTGVVDYVAMDVKAPRTKYSRLSGRESVDVEQVAASVDLLCRSGITAEFRTTVVPGLLDGDDVEAIAQWLSECGDRKSVSYVLQQFRGIRTLDPALEGAAPYPTSELVDMAACARRWIDHVALRGV